MPYRYFPIEFSSYEDYIKYADNYSHEIWHKLMDNFKNIKDYHIGCNEVSDIVLNAIIDTCNWLEKQGQQKPAWSDEDDIMLNQAIEEVEYALNDKSLFYTGNENVLIWLKSLKARLKGG